MSRYEVSRLLREIGQKEELRSALINDPEPALKDYDLSPAERSALLDGDVGFLYRMGINTYLLGRLAGGCFGLDAEKYSERIRAEADD